MPTVKEWALEEKNVERVFHKRTMDMKGKKTRKGIWARKEKKGKVDKKGKMNIKTTWTS
jgi:hypothetical protein